MDLLVVGAGVAGVAAALAGARSGLTVLLVEREAALGGTAVHGLIGALCGLYRNGGSTPGEALQGGITAEIAAALLDAAPARELKKVGRVFVLPFAGHELLSLLNDRCRREPRISPCYGSKPVALSVDRGRVTTVTLALADALVTVVPGAVIDASGNGDAAALAGADFDLAPAEQLQLAGFTAKVCGLVDVDSSLSLKVPFAVAKGVEAGAVPARCRYTVFSAAEQAGGGISRSICRLSPHRTRPDLPPSPPVWLPGSAASCPSSGRRPSLPPPVAPSPGKGGASSATIC